MNKEQNELIKYLKDNHPWYVHHGVDRREPDGYNICISKVEEFFSDQKK